MRARDSLPSKLRITVNSLMTRVVRSTVTRLRVAIGATVVNR